MQLSYYLLDKVQRLITDTFDLCYLLGVHPDVDASTDPEVEPAER